MYNSLLIKYEKSYQLRLYEFDINTSDDIIENKKFISFDEVENEIDNAFAKTDDKYHLDGHSAYVSINRSKNKIFYYSRSNNWDNGYFCTLTINPDKYDSYDYKVVSDLIRKFTRSIREYDNKAYGLFVPELHKSGRFHLHGLIGGIDLEKEGFIKYSGHNYNNSKIYNFVKAWKYGFSNVTKVQNSIAVEKYVTKYTTKELLNNTLFQHRYFTFGLNESPIEKHKAKPDLFNDLMMYHPELVQFCNTDGCYNRVTYLELKKCKLTDDFLKKYFYKD